MFFNKFSPASEIIKFALRLFEQEETKKGENFGFNENFKRDFFLILMYHKYSSREL